MRIPDNILEEIQNKVDILEVVGAYVSLEKRGYRYWGCCPFHNEKTPSFTVTPDKNMYYCFGCHKGGSVFNFLMEKEHLSFPEAVQQLGEKVGIKIETTHTGESSVQKQTKEALKELYRRVAGTFSYLLKNDSAGQKAYQLIRSRGIEDEIIEKFGLGYAPDDSGWLYHFLKKKNYTDDFLAQSGLFSRNKEKMSLFWNRLMFPIYDKSGQVVAFSGRSLNPDEKRFKYVNSPETSIFHKGSLLYGLGQAYEAIRKERRFILCEGNVDVMALHQIGYTNTVAPLGTAFTEMQGRILKRISDKGIIVFDGDEAGQKATRKAGELGETLQISLKTAKMPVGEDPASILLEKGDGELKKILKYPINIFEYLLECSLRAFDTKTLEGREEVIKDLLPFISRTSSEVKKDLYLEKLSETINVDKKALTMDFSRTRHTFPTSVQSITEKQEPLFLTDDLYLMLALSQKISYFSRMESLIGRNDLQDTKARQFYDILKNCPEERKTEHDFELSESDFEDDELYLLYKDRSGSAEFGDQTEQIIEDHLKKIRLRTLIRRNNEINLVLKQNEERENPQIINELLQEKIKLDREIERVKGNGL